MGCNESKVPQINVENEMQSTSSKDVMIELDELQKNFFVLDSESAKMKLSLYLVSELQQYKKLPVAHYKSQNIQTEEFYSGADNLNDTRNILQASLDLEFQIAESMKAVEKHLNIYVKSGKTNMQARQSAIDEVKAQKKLQSKSQKLKPIIQKWVQQLVSMKKNFEQTLQDKQENLSKFIDQARLLNQQDNYIEFQLHVDKTAQNSALQEYTTLPLSTWPNSSNLGQYKPNQKQQQQPQQQQQLQQANQLQNIEASQQITNFILTENQRVFFQKYGLVALEMKGQTMLHGIDVKSKGNIIFYQLKDDPMQRQIQFKQYQQLKDEKYKTVMYPIINFENVQAFQGGCCFLSEYLEKLRQNQVYWWDRELELKYLIVQLYHLQQDLEKKGLFFSNMDVHDLVLVEGRHNFDTVYEISCSPAIIHASSNFAQVNKYKPCIFPTFMQTFLNVEDRMLAERYVLGKIILEIMMDSIICFKLSNMIIKGEKFNQEQEYQYQKSIFQTNSREALIDILYEVDQFYTKDFVKLLRQLLLDFESKEIIDITVHDCFIASMEYIRDYENIIYNCKHKYLFDYMQQLQKQEQYDEALKLCDDLELYYLGFQMFNNTPTVMARRFQQVTYAFYYLKFCYELQKLYEIEQFVQKLQQSEQLMRFEEQNKEFFVQLFEYQGLQEDNQLEKGKQFKAEDMYIKQAQMHFGENHVITVKSILNQCTLVIKSSKYDESTLKQLQQIKATTLSLIQSTEQDNIYDLFQLNMLLAKIVLLASEYYRVDNQKQQEQSCLDEAQKICISFHAEKRVIYKQTSMAKANALKLQGQIDDSLSIYQALLNCNSENYSSNQLLAQTYHEIGLIYQDYKKEMETALKLYEKQTLIYRYYLENHHYYYKLISIDQCLTFMYQQIYSEDLESKIRKRWKERGDSVILKSENFKIALQFYLIGFDLAEKLKGNDAKLGKLMDELKDDIERCKMEMQITSSMDNEEQRSILNEVLQKIPANDYENKYRVAKKLSQLYLQNNLVKHIQRRIGNIDNYLIKKNEMKAKFSLMNGLILYIDQEESKAIGRFRSARLLGEELNLRYIVGQANYLLDIADPFKYFMGLKQPFVEFYDKLFFIQKSESKFDEKKEIYYQIQQQKVYSILGNID